MWSQWKASISGTSRGLPSQLASFFTISISESLGQLQRSTQQVDEHSDGHVSQLTMKFSKPAVNVALLVGSELQDPRCPGLMSSNSGRTASSRCTSPTSTASSASFPKVGIPSWFCGSHVSSLFRMTLASSAQLQRQQFGVTRIELVRSVSGPSITFSTVQPLRHGA